MPPGIPPPLFPLVRSVGRQPCRPTLLLASWQLPRQHQTTHKQTNTTPPSVVNKPRFSSQPQHNTHSSHSDSARNMPPPPSPLPPLPPPPPPPLFPASSSIPGTSSATKPLSPLASNPNPPPDDARLVSLLIYNGHPFADHWEYFVASPWDPDVGVVIQAAGDVRGGFWLEVKRGWDLRREGRGCSVRRVPLAWVGRGWFEPVEGVFGDENGVVVVEGQARCGFERALFEVPAPGKTLRAVEEMKVSWRAKV